MTPLLVRPGRPRWRRRRRPRWRRARGGRRGPAARLGATWRSPAGSGLGIAAVNGFQVWFWDLLVEARQGQAARARLAAAEERLRFARDVHDLLGHDLTVIALKAELAARLAPVDPARAGREAAEVQRLAASALHRVREAVHGYRAVDLAEQLAAVAEVLRSCGVRCTSLPPPGDLPARRRRRAGGGAARGGHQRAAAQPGRLVPDRDHPGGDVARMTVRNDGADRRRPGRAQPRAARAGRAARRGRRRAAHPPGRTASSPWRRPCRWPP